MATRQEPTNGESSAAGEKRMRQILIEEEEETQATTPATPQRSGNLVVEGDMVNDEDGSDRYIRRFMQENFQVVVNEVVPVQPPSLPSQVRPIISMFSRFPQGRYLDNFMRVNVLEIWEHVAMETTAKIQEKSNPTTSGLG
jgi:hypothetical protein